MMSFFLRDVLDEIWDLIESVLRVFLPTFTVAGYRWTADFKFYVLPTVFQSYQNDVRLIMKGCVQQNSVYG